MKQELLGISYISLPSLLFLGLGFAFTIHQYKEAREDIRFLQSDVPEKIIDFNQDGLDDIVYSSGKIFVQTDSGFVNREVLLEQNRAYADSIRNVYLP